MAASGNSLCTSNCTNGWNAGDWSNPNAPNFNYSVAEFLYNDTINFFGSGSNWNCASGYAGADD